MTIILSYRQAYLHKMKEDPIVAEIHAIRDKLAAKSGYDVERVVPTAAETRSQVRPRLCRLPALLGAYDQLRHNAWVNGKTRWA